MGVYMSGNAARHMDSHTQLTEEELRKALWSDFVVMQQAEALIFAGRVSGFSGTAASMGLMPASKVMVVAGGAGEALEPPLQASLRGGGEAVRVALSVIRCMVPLRA